MDIVNGDQLNLDSTKMPAPLSQKFIADHWSESAHTQVEKIYPVLATHTYLEQEELQMLS